MHNVRYTGRMSRTLFISSLASGVTLAALIVFMGGMNAALSMPSEFSQPAQALNGGACDKRANVSAKGGGISGGETQATKQEKEACIPQACYTDAEGKQVCGVKPALQAAAGGGGGLMDSIGKMLEKFMGGGEKGGGDSGAGGSQASIDYEYGTKPVCSEFEASSGNQPTQEGASVFLSWVRTGGKTEQVTITPAVGISVAESPVEIKTPAKSTTYTLSVSNRSGASICTTRIFVGPKGAQLSAEDRAYVATEKSVADAREGTATVSARVTNPLCKKSRYGDLDAECETRAAEQAKLGAAERAKAGADTAASTGILYGAAESGPLIAAQGKTEQSYIDERAFEADPNAFTTDDNAFATDGRAFGEDGGTNSGTVRSGAELDALEARMRAVMSDKTQVRPVQVGSGERTWGRPDVGVTGGLGDAGESSSTNQNKVESNESGLFGRFGAWVKNSFCFWCVAGKTQGANVLLADTGEFSIPSRDDGTVTYVSSAKKEIEVPKSLEGLKMPTVDQQNKALNAAGPEFLEGKCKNENEAEKAKFCTGTGDRVATCRQAYDSYKDANSRIPFENKKIEESSTGKASSVKNGVQQCKKKSELDPACVEKCKGKGIDELPPKIAKDPNAGNKIIWCNKPKNLACRENPAADKPGAGGAGAGASDKKGPSADPAAAGKDGAGGGGGNPLGGLMDSKMGQGMGEGLMKGLMSMLKGGGGSGSGAGGGAAAADQCNSYFAQFKAECNPQVATVAPTCAAAGATTDEALAVSPSVIYLGQTSNVSWSVTGKGKITTIVVYTTTDAAGREVKGNLGVVDGTSGSKDVSPEKSTTYTLKASNEIGTTTCKPVRISVRPKTAADDKVTASADGLDTLLSTSTKKFSVTCTPEEYAAGSGDQPTVEWQGCPAGSTSTLGTSSEDGAFSTTGDADDASVDVNPKRDSTYVVRCRDQYNEELARASCRMNVTNPTGASGQSSVQTNKTKPTVDIFIDKEDEFVDYGQSVRVEWRSKNAASCYVYGPGCKKFGRSSPKCFKEVGRAGFVVGNIYETTEFVVECRGADRKSIATDDVLISVGSGAAADVTEEQAAPSPSRISPPASTESQSSQDASLDDLLNAE
jgi:hypothetical protein